VPDAGPPPDAGPSAVEWPAVGSTSAPSGKGSFRFGAASAATQIEDQNPATDWFVWTSPAPEGLGKGTFVGDASKGYSLSLADIDLLAEMHLDSYRFSIEWARCVPQRGRIDDDAFSQYADMLRACRDRGLEPILALHHFNQPDWLGRDFWLQHDSPDEFTEWVEIAVSRLGSLCDRWITINEINACALGSYFIGYFPPGRRARRASFVATMDNMLTGHIAAYDVIHRLQPHAKVGHSTFAFWCYDVDRILTDTLSARSLGVPREQFDHWIAERRRAYHEELLAEIPRRSGWKDEAIHRILRSVLRVDRGLTRATDAAYASPHDRCLDVKQVNFYDPRLSNFVRMPGRISAGKRQWRPDPKHWEQRPCPELFATYLQANHQPGQEIWILENGLCSPVVHGRQLPREDGWDRPRYLRANLAAVVDAIDAGVEVTSYFHWALFDNYQWGEYESAFGLYGVDRGVGRDGEPKFLDLDSMGDDSAGAYRTIIEGLRAGDRSVLAAPPAR